MESDTVSLSVDLDEDLYLAFEKICEIENRDPKEYFVQLLLESQKKYSKK